MLGEKMNLLKNIGSLQQACAAIEIAKPVKVAIEEACEKLSPILESSTFLSVDGEIKTALTSIYHILETAKVGLNDESISPIFVYEEGTEQRPETEQ